MNAIPEEEIAGWNGVPPEKICRVWIVEDHASVRQMLELFVSSMPGFVVAGASVDEVPAIEAATQAAVDVVLLDLMLPGQGGMNALKRMSQVPAAPRTVIFSATATAHSLRLAIALGAFGYVDKADALDELQVALQRVRSGGVHFSDRPSRLLTAMMAEGRAMQAPTDRKELSVLELLAAGRSVSETAADLRLSKKKIYGIRQTLMNHAKARSPTELIRYAREIGLNGPPRPAPVDQGSGPDGEFVSKMNDSDRS